MTQLVLSANTCFAVKNWPEPGSWLECVRSWGLGSVQFSLDLLDPLMPGAIEVASEIGRAASAQGVEIASTFTGGRAYAANMLLHPDRRYRDWAMAWLTAAVDVTAAMGAPATGGHVAALALSDTGRDGWSVGGGLGPAAIRALADDAAELGRHAAGAGLEYLLLEAMPNPLEIPHTPADVHGLLSAINEKSPVPFELCYDLGHACGYDLAADPERAYAWLEQLLTFVRCVHLQQTDGLGDRHWPFTARHNASGIISPERVLGILRRSPRERVDLAFEVLHPPEVSPSAILADWAEGVALWQAAMGDSRPARLAKTLESPALEGRAR